MITKLMEITDKIPEDKKSEADILVNELQFISDQMADLKDSIAKYGCVDNFKQGKQEFLRESPYLTAYNKLAKTYDTFLKRLFDLVPKEVLMSDDEIDSKYF